MSEPMMMAARDQLPRERRQTFVWYLTSVTVVGLLAASLVLAQGAHRLPDAMYAAAWAAVVLVVAGEVRPLLTPAQWDIDGVPVSTAFFLALLSTVGPALVMILVAVSSVLTSIGAHRAWWRTAFNIAQTQLSWLAAAGVLLAFHHDAHPIRGGAVGGREILVTLLAGVTYFLVNNAFVDMAIALRERVSFREVVERDLGFQALSTFALLALAPIIVVIMGLSVWFMPLLLPPLGAVYVTVAVSRDRDRQSLHDALTGLPNRVLLLQRLELELAPVRNGRVRQGGLLLLDLDRFKEVNDTLGHHVGDELLVTVAERLRAAVRPEDTVARLGGDEFAILLPGVIDTESALWLAARVERAMEEPFRHGEMYLDVMVSIGVALYPLHAGDVEGLLRHADVAMYQAKTSRTGLCVYSAATDYHSEERLALLGDLRRAVDNAELEVHFQPKVDLRTGFCTGMEALLRWDHPQSGPMPPRDFIRLAEQSSVMGAITCHVLDTAIAQVARWRTSGMAVTVAVNVSMRDLADREFLDGVRALLAVYGVPGAALTLEVTERVLAEDPAAIAAMLSDLTDLGVRLALDDFGTGYSSLARLEMLPVSEVKIDQTFVARLHDDDDAPIVRSCVEMAHALGLTVTAEGVEEERILQALQRYGCDHIQGYLIAAPMAVAEATAWLTGFPGLDVPAIPAAAVTSAGRPGEPTPTAARPAVVAAGGFQRLGVSDLVQHQWGAADRRRDAGEMSQA